MCASLEKLRSPVMLPVGDGPIPAREHRGLPISEFLPGDQRLIDLDAEPGRVADRIMRALEAGLNGEELAAVESQMRLRGRGPGLEPGEIGHGGREMDRGGG